MTAMQFRYRSTAVNRVTGYAKPFSCGLESEAGPVFVTRDETDRCASVRRDPVEHLLPNFDRHNLVT